MSRASQERETQPQPRRASKEAMEAFAAHCRAHGLSVTRQRLAIFEALAGSRAHPSAEQLHALVQKKNPSLSLATIYKNLEALRAIGAVSDVNPLHAQGRYEASLPGTGAGESHHHLVCTVCHTVCDLPSSALPRPTLREEDAQGFEVREVRVQVEGRCPRCRA
jgi:Fur family peroxide stress response transcriptional regulator